MVETEVMGALLKHLPNEKDQAILKTRGPDVDIVLADLDLDSLRAVELCMQLEDTLGVEIDLDEFEQIESVSALVAHCEQLVAAKSG